MYNAYLSLYIIYIYIYGMLHYTKRGRDRSVEKQSKTNQSKW